MEVDHQKNEAHICDDQARFKPTFFPVMVIGLIDNILIIQFVIVQFVVQPIHVDQLKSCDLNHTSIDRVCILREVRPQEWKQYNYLLVVQHLPDFVQRCL